jgi:hypothetical protein
MGTMERQISLLSRQLRSTNLFRNRITKRTLGRTQQILDRHMVVISSKKRLRKTKLGMKKGFLLSSLQRNNRLLTLHLHL